jgi:hypothetical protein
MDQSACWKIDTSHGPIQNRLWDRYSLICLLTEHGEMDIHTVLARLRHARHLDLTAIRQRKSGIPVDPLRCWPASSLHTTTRQVVVNRTAARCLQGE